MNMKKLSYALMSFLVVMTAFSCGGKKSPEPAQDEEGLIEITPEQFKNSGMALGMPAQKTFAERVACKGYISAPANAMSKISPSIAGKVNAIYFKIGDYVQKGHTVATISGNEFMDLQQQFAESAAAFTKAKLDYERASALWAEKIGAEKDFLTAKSIFLSTKASYQSLRSRIVALNLNPSGIERGRMYTSFPVVAPISGYLTKTNAVIGQFVSMADDIAEIVNVSGLQLKLQVYETDIDRLKVGQTVQYQRAENPGNLQSARLVSIGKTIDPESKTIDCMAAIDKSAGALLINDSYVEAAVVVNQFTANALPATAVQKQGNEYFVFVVEKRKGSSYMLRKMPVSVGHAERDYVEITTPLPGKKIVVRGIDTLQ